MFKNRVCSQYVMNNVELPSVFLKVSSLQSNADYDDNHDDLFTVPVRISSIRLSTTVSMVQLRTTGFTSVCFDIEQNITLQITLPAVISCFREDLIIGSQCAMLIVVHIPVFLVFSKCNIMSFIGFRAKVTDMRY